MRGDCGTMSETDQRTMRNVLDEHDAPSICYVVAEVNEGKRRTSEVPNSVWRDVLEATDGDVWVKVVDKCGRCTYFTWFDDYVLAALRRERTSFYRHHAEDLLWSMVGKWDHVLPVLEEDVSFIAGDET